MLDSVISKIEEQQKGIENTAAWCVGEQLKDMASSDSAIAELLSKDLDIKEMSIVEAEKKIKDYADNHRKGKCGFVPPKEADRILREFYGLPGVGVSSEDTVPKAEDKPSSKVIDISDFL